MTETTRKSRQKTTYWQEVSLCSEASKQTIHSWFMNMSDGMTPTKAEILCDIDTDREKKLRVFMIDAGGDRHEFTRTVGGEMFTITCKKLPKENDNAAA